MITVYKNNKLKHQNRIYNCSLGINGLTKNKIEGDGCTPIGSFSLGRIFYRIDRVKKLEVKKNARENNKKLGKLVLHALVFKKNVKNSVAGLRAQWMSPQPRQA